MPIPGPKAFQPTDTGPTPVNPYSQHAAGHMSPVGSNVLDSVSNFLDKKFVEAKHLKYLHAKDNFLLEFNSLINQVLTKTKNKTVGELSPTDYHYLLEAISESTRLRELANAVKNAADEDKQSSIDDEIINAYYRDHAFLPPHEDDQNPQQRFTPIQLQKLLLDVKFEQKILFAQNRKEFLDYLSEKQYQNYDIALLIERRIERDENGKITELCNFSGGSSSHVINALEEITKEFNNIIRLNPNNDKTSFSLKVTIPNQLNDDLKKQTYKEQELKKFYAKVSAHIQRARPKLKIFDSSIDKPLRSSNFVLVSEDLLNNTNEELRKLLSGNNQNNFLNKDFTERLEQYHQQHGYPTPVNTPINTPINHCIYNTQPLSQDIIKQMQREYLDRYCYLALSEIHSIPTQGENGNPPQLSPQALAQQQRNWITPAVLEGWAQKYDVSKELATELVYALTIPLERNSMPIKVERDEQTNKITNITVYVGSADEKNNLETGFKDIVAKLPKPSSNARVRRPDDSMLSGAANPSNSAAQNNPLAQLMGSMGGMGM